MLCGNCGKACGSLKDGVLCGKCHSDDRIFLSQKPEIRKKFLDLACSLSPENLTCDGELSIAESRRRYRRIMAEWRELEKRVGRKITEDAVWAYEYGHPE